MAKTAQDEHEMTHATCTGPAWYSSLFEAYDDVVGILAQLDVEPVIDEPLQTRIVRALKNYQSILQIGIKSGAIRITSTEESDA